MHKRLDTELCGDRVPVCDTALELRKPVTDFVASTVGKGQTKMPLLLALMLVVSPHAALHVISLIAMMCTDYLNSTVGSHARAVVLSPDRAAVKVAKYLAR